MYEIDSVAPTVCKLMGVSPPLGSTAEPIREILEVTDRLEGGEVQKVLLYAPDAIGEWIFQKHKENFKQVIEKSFR